MAHDFMIEKYFWLESSSRCGWIVVGNWGWKKIFILHRRQEQMIKIEKNGRKFRSIFIINFDFISYREQNCCQRSYVKRITWGQGWQFFKETAVSYDVRRKFFSTAIIVITTTSMLSPSNSGILHYLLKDCFNLYKAGSKRHWKKPSLFQMPSDFVQPHKTILGKPV